MIPRSLAFSFVVWTLIAAADAAAQCQGSGGRGNARPPLPGPEGVPIPGLATGPSRPAAPSTPAAARPVSPAPLPPAGITPRAPVIPGATPTAAPFGGFAPRIAVTRERTSKDRLLLRWDYRAYRKQISAGETATVMPDRALPTAEAFAFLANGDPRPLLVMRECRHCVGKETAFLREDQDNDETLLLAQWFHCIKLPNHALEPDHPLRKVFAAKDPAHVFLSSADGSNYIAMNGVQSQSQLWRWMYWLLGKEYENDPKRSMREQLKLLARYDHLDQRLDDLRERSAEELETRGPGSSKLKKYQKDIEKLEREKQKALERESILIELGLKRPKPTMTDADVSANP